NRITNTHSIKDQKAKRRFRRSRKRSNSVQRGDMGGIGKIFSDFLTRGASGSDEREVEHARAEYAVSHVDFDEMMEIVLGQLRETLEDFDFETEDVRGVVENLNNRVNSLIDQ
ncbi:MAG: hypothetical protein QF384_19475, partial [Alphaproteobacteria bacterium]|nr:hypothetical protein [Alphaproteobacteria bacterium]